MAAIRGVWNIWGSCIFLLLSLSMISWISAEGNKTVINRKHVGVWFDYSVRYYDHEADNAYSKQDLAVMVNMVSKRFGRIAIDNAPILDKLPPNSSVHSRVWVPSVAAQHNKDDPSNPLEVIVTFDAAKIMRTSELKSFDVAKYMADSANDISPGTVKTLMMFSGFSIFSLFYNNVRETVQQLRQARETINSTDKSKHYYDLGIFLDLKDCGHFKGAVGQKIKDVLPHVELVAFLHRPNYHHMSLKPESIYKMFVAKFDDCEKKLRQERSQVKILPVVLWMSRKGSPQAFVQFWSLMSNWAEKNGREVIMYEAFDTPHGRLISDQGWWRLKDKAEHEIRPDVFVEKIQELNQTSSSRVEYSSLEDTSDEDGESPISFNTKSMAVSSNYSYQQPPSSIYIVVVLLCVICTLLVAVIVGLVWGFHTMVVRKSDCNGYSLNSNFQTETGHHHHQRRQQPRSSSYSNSSNNEEGASVNGTVLEIRDTAPIVAVTYRK